MRAKYAERVIKTLKSRLSRFMTKQQTHRWVDILPKSPRVIILLIIVQLIWLPNK